MKVLLLVGTLFLATAAQASTIMPVYSETSFAAAANSCRARGGSFVGDTMETSSATDTSFYVVACARRNGNHITDTVAWSADSFQNARQRCETDSVTTGLPAGIPVGKARYINPSQPDIYITLCQLK